MQSVNKHCESALAGSKILTILLLTFLTSNIMAQTEYKRVNEAQGLQVGTTITDFSATDVNGNTFNLQEALQKGPVVLVFYRGQWCPVCNRHLSNLQDSLQLIYSAGASVIAVSPEKQEYLKKTADKTHATFTLLYDEGYKIANQFDVTFKPDAITRTLYNTALGADLKNANSDDSERLPIPATFIIGKDSKIVWRQFDPDYKKRSTVEDILNNLPLLSN